MVLESAEGFDLTFDPCIKSQLLEKPEFDLTTCYKNCILMLCDVDEGTAYKSTDCIV